MEATTKTTNVQRLRSAMAEANLPALLLSNIDSVQWATGFTGSSGFVLLTEKDGAFLTDSRYTIQAHEQVADLPTVTQTPGTTQIQFFSEQIQRFNLRSIGFESESVTFATHRDWSEKISIVEWKPTKNLVGQLRCIKTAEEVEKIRRACALADQCAEHIVRFIRPGASEWDLNLEIEFFFRRHAADLAFEPVVVSGERSARPHGRASQKLLDSGDFLTLDFGCKIEGYCSDITRTFVVGEATDRHRHIYAEVLRSNEAAIAAIRPGRSGKEIDQIARDVLAETDLAQYFGHGLGHGLGRLVHDFGGLSQRSETVLAPGMVMTVEPGVYIEGFGGVRIEDDIVVTESGCEVLTKAPKSFCVLP